MYDLAEIPAVQGGQIDDLQSAFQLYHSVILRQGYSDIADSEQMKGSNFFTEHIIH